MNSGVLMMQMLWQDLKFALRTLAKSPGFTVVAVLTLALGIGVNVAIFSVVNTVLLKPLPYPDPDRIVAFMNISPQGEGQYASATKFNAWREQSNVFQDVSAYRFGLVNIGGGSYPEQIHSGVVTADFFRLFGVPVAQGRTFGTEEDRPGGGHVAVISDGMWKRQFGSDPQIVGKTISLDGEPYDVIGVLGANFDTRSFDLIPDVWLPFQIDPDSIDQANYFVAAGRLKPGVMIGAANAQLKLAADEFRRKFAGINALGPKGSFGVKPIMEVMVGNVRSSLLILLGAVSFVLLIACANVANLLLIRATGRKREIAVRVAMGAGRGRIIRQLLTESVVLSTAGGALGMVLGIVGIRALLAVSPGGISRIGQDGSLVTLDWRVVTFTIFVSLIAGVLFGLIPALQASRTDLSTALKEGSGRSGTGFHQNKARSLLVVSEMALALILLAGSALLIRTYVALRNVNPGFDSHNVLTMRMSLTALRYQKTAALAQLIRDGVQRVGALPGVTVATATCCIPLENGYGLPFAIVGRPIDSPPPGGGWLLISAGYFDAFKIPVLRGRAFTDRDEAGAPPVVIINQVLARKYWPNGDPLNDRLVIGKGVGPEFEGDPPRQIVGVVGDVHGGGLDHDPGPTMYIPEAQVLDGENALGLRITPLAWVIRTSVNPNSVSTAIQNELRQASGGFPVGNIRPMDEVVSRSTARQDFNMLLMSVFAGSALVLAAIGIYGLMSYSVQQRTQEIGIRMALGAESSTVRTMVVLQGMRLTLIGVAIGIAVAFGLARFMGSFLFGVRPWDPAAFVTVPIILSAVALIAAWIPARRASRVDPMIALRHE
jgi:putative ABC transport system permease protein